ncbi:MAG: hypothetical protein HC780_27435 [Leptolyngbyaceae cyanobacterium CSU_1_3]|nr:hypothetical protein [Leptolyngbyaceae cyanobacterium CSU_1_3]
MRRPPTPIATRYLLARLRPLTRPVFWGPAIVLMLMVLFTWELWTRPEFLSYLGISDTPAVDEEALTAEDRAIGADIDTLPLLLNDVGISASAANSDQPNSTKPGTPQSTSLATLQSIPIAGSTATSQPQATSGLFASLNPSLQSFGLPNVSSNLTSDLTGDQSARANPSQTPFGAATQQQIFAAQTFATNNALNLSAPPSSPLPQSPLPQSPLQAALEKFAIAPNPAAPPESRPPLTPSSFTTVPDAPIEGTTTLGSFGITATPSSKTNSTANSFTSLVEGSQPLSGSQSSLSGVAPPINPSITPNAIPINPVQPSLPVQGLGAAPDAFAPQSSTDVIPPSNLPLSVPRPIPGRFIGGGQINTFSNP